MVARRSQRLDALVERITADGGRAVATACDVADEDQARQFVNGVHAEFGRLDVLVNDAAAMLLGTITAAPTEEWSRMIDVNVFGVLYAISQPDRVSVSELLIRPTSQQGGAPRPARGVRAALRSRRASCAG